MKRIICVLLAALLLFVCGCNPPSNKVEEPEAPIWEPEVPETPDLTAYLSAEDVRAATGINVGEGVLEENDTVLLFATETYSTQVSFLLEKPQVDATQYLEALTAQYSEGALIDVQNLGDKAYWCAQSGELLVSGKEHIISVNLVSNVLNSDACLIAARQLATKVLNKLA